MFRQFFIRLNPQEYAALYKLATCERRDVRDQAAIIIRHELERLCLLETAKAELPFPSEVTHGEQPAA